MFFDCFKGSRFLLQGYRKNKVVQLHMTSWKQSSVHLARNSTINGRRCRHCIHIWLSGWIWDDRAFGHIGSLCGNFHTS